MSRRTVPAATVYLTYEIVSTFAFTMMATIYMVYLIKETTLNPLQLVLLGTVLEAGCLVFEVPTGILADAISRRASVITGTFLHALSLVLIGSLHGFGALAAVQVLWALAYTFESGADVAWITDEVGEARASKLFVRANQIAQVPGLAGIAAGVGLATISLGLPLVLGGVLCAALGLFLLIAMPEDNFTRPERAPGAGRFSLLPGLKDGVGMVRRRPVLVLIFAVAAFHGAATEGFDRLSGLHLIEGIGLPAFAGQDPVLWFGVIAAGSMILVMAAMEVVNRKVDLTNHRSSARALAVIDTLLIGSVVGFALAGRFVPALGALWAAAVLREVREPIFTAWVNQGLDPRSRATVHSMGSQVDAFGQIGAGPGLGLLAVRLSVPGAIVISGLLRLPALALFAWALRRAPEAPGQPPELTPAPLALEAPPGP